MNYHLISTIIKGVWAINEESALGYAPLLNNIMGGSPIAFEFDQEQFKIGILQKGASEPMKASADEQDAGIFNNAAKGSIAIIPLSGPLMKNDQYCGPVGTETIREFIEAAGKSPNIDGIILKIDSPGGTVDGTVALSDTIKGINKPIIAFADGLMASAALWVGASADEIIAANNKTEIGSVGVLLSFADMQPAYEKLGVKFHTIAADQSKDKTKMFDDIRAGKYDDYKKEVLNPIAEDFQNHIRANRPNVTDDQLTGKVYFAENLVGSLVDSIGNMDHAIARMGELIEGSNQIKNKPNKNTAEMKQFSLINAAINVDALESTDEGVFLNEEQLAQIESALETGNTATAALEAAQTAQQDAEANLTTANETISTLTSEVEDLKKKPGSESAKAVASNDKVVEKEKDGNISNDSKDFMENVNAVAEELL